MVTRIEREDRRVKVGQNEYENITKHKFWLMDKNKCLDLLGKHTGALVERSVTTHEVGNSFADMVKRMNEGK